MPNYARQSLLDLDEMYGNYIKNDSSVAMMRNIRTKEKMNSAHHCEDKECNGSPSMRCVSALHFCWCLAPIVDEDKKSATYGQVVVCGQRFQCISPKGCAVHPYLEGYNIDIRDARNGYPTTKVKWKLIFEAFKAEHDAALADDAEQQELSRKWAGMTDHQKLRQLKLQDQTAFQKRRKQERAVGRELGCRPPLTIVADLGRGELSSRGQDTSLAGDGEIVGVVSGSFGLHIAYRVPSARLLVGLTYTVKDDYRPTPPVSRVLPSTEATSILGTSAIASLPPATHSESLFAPTEDGEVADEQASIEILATRLRGKETKEAKRQRASKMHAADPMAKAASKVNRKKNPRGISKDEIIMSEMSPRGGKGVKGGKTSISGGTVLHRKTRGCACL